MANIIRHIPDNIQDGLSKITSLSEKKIEQLMEVFEQTPIILRIKDYNQNILPNVDFLDSDVAESIITTIVSLYGLSNDLEIPIEEFVDEVVSALKDNEDKSISNWSNAKRKKLSQRLFNLLNINTLNVRAKTVSLILEQDKFFQEARLVSDIRPIFGSNIDEDPIGAVFIHTLKIEYKNNDESKNFYVTLDDEGIETLIDLLKRTRTKSESLSRFIKNTGIQNYEIK